MIVASNIVREDNKLKETMPRAPQPNDLSPENFNIPHSPDIMLTTDLNSDGSRASRRKRSLVQDLAYIATHGHVKTPKSILLLSIIKTLTNNTEFINMIIIWGMVSVTWNEWRPKLKMHTKY